ncbi:hypothetical protein KAFR_0E01040 [Kazachstania africana CBS 2517]|uniref:Protein kinase domain-containing protein n=1 Tax=Kazachstania africana (strain ATCC 22294 / BCRC 22015 / CBS 2517 / CECT 1963 / NBRC 1671 / NRRL Y-8276) TaxID=1071382 RepID=H2AV58_KAZAF|nr:hypothetical protein KAFR_0E01040 [Kazachstania africana CBS 2517]CCF58258.1 hypothetical protein KAFR_0E01040 [Kazachstania africana CBS 2517]
MIFSLDEELEKLAVTSAPSSPKTSRIMDYSEHAIADTFQSRLELKSLSTSTSGRRRSSVLAKFPVLNPIHTRRVSISNNDGTFTDTNASVSASKIQITDFDNDGKNISRSIQDFKPIRVLGKGAYSKVVLVKDHHSNKLYAMKQLKKAEILINEKEVREDSEDPTTLQKRIERTFAERIILSKLEHPNVVKLFYSFHDHSKLYLILQYIPGGELFFHLKERGTLDEDTVAFYAAEISVALKFLHDNGIVYRDLKPENCLLSQRGHLVLTDFGLSKEAVDNVSDNESTELNSPEDIYTLHSIIGTPEYAAPEILQGLPYNKNCDWYSLGCLLFDMLVGKPPYTGTNHKVILNKIQKDKQGPRIPFYLSDGMKDMLNWLLKKDKTKRWDVDKYWSEDKPYDTKQPNNKKKKPGKQRITKFQSHFIFRKIDWKLLENGDLQRTTVGPIVPVITDWELAENFDIEFTSMSYEDDYLSAGLPIEKQSTDVFKGFSYNASGSYLEKYF